MPLLTIFIVIIVFGILLWLANTYIPMERGIKILLNAIVIIILALWLLQVFGILGTLSAVRVD